VLRERVGAASLRVEQRKVDLAGLMHLRRRLERQGQVLRVVELFGRAGVRHGRVELEGRSLLLSGTVASAGALEAIRGAAVPAGWTFERDQLSARPAPAPADLAKLDRWPGGLPETAPPDRGVQVHALDAPAGALLALLPSQKQPWIVSADADLRASGRVHARDRGGAAQALLRASPALRRALGDPDAKSGHQAQRPVSLRLVAVKSPLLLQLLGQVGERNVVAASPLPPVHAACDAIPHGRVLAALADVLQLPLYERDDLVLLPVERWSGPGWVPSAGGPQLDLSLFGARLVDVLRLVAGVPQLGLVARAEVAERRLNMRLRGVSARQLAVALSAASGASWAEPGAAGLSPARGPTVDPVAEGLRPGLWMLRGVLLGTDGAHVALVERPDSSALVLRPGGRVGTWRVESATPDGLDLVGPDRERLLVRPAGVLAADQDYPPCPPLPEPGADRLAATVLGPGGRAAALFEAPRGEVTVLVDVAAAPHCTTYPRIEAGRVDLLERPPVHGLATPPKARATFLLEPAASNGRVRATVGGSRKRRMEGDDG